MRLTSALILLVTACLGGSETRTVSDTGSLCVTSLQDGSLSVVATFDVCLSSSCDHPTVSTCQAVEKDGVIRIRSHGEWEQDSGTGSVCTLDCGSLDARCRSAPIAPGTYTVAYGEKTGSIELPATGIGLFRDTPCE